MLGSRTRSNRGCALLLAASLAATASGACNSQQTPPPPVDDTAGGRMAPGGPRAPQPSGQTGMSTRGKLVVLAGAAALYYLYKRHKNAAATEGAESQYYLSKNGRVYYRDAEHRAHWVTPPPGGIQVPASEAAEYEGFQGYDNRETGRDLVGLGADPE